MCRILSAALLLMLALPAIATTPINETRSLSPTGRVDIDNLKGRIQVRGWDRDEVRIEGRLGKGVERLIVEGDRNRLEVSVRYPRSSKRAEPTELLLHVPRRTELNIESVSADIDVEGVAAACLAAESVSGDVLIAAAPRRLQASTVSGDLAVTANSADVRLETVSGQLTLRGRLNGTISAETVSGDIDITVNGEQVTSLKSSTVSGDIGIRTALARDGDIRMDSISGDLLLVVPSSVSARLTAETFSGNLRAPDAQINRPRYGPGASCETRYGDGNGIIRMQSHSGDTELRLR